MCLRPEVANKPHLTGPGRKFALLTMVVRENGLVWTFWFGIYYLGSALNAEGLSSSAFARMDKLRRAGYTGAFHSLEAGIEDYVRRYLMTGRGL